MSYAGFHARNHPQQVRARGTDLAADRRATPALLFSLLHARFEFTVDVAALPDNAKLPRFYTPADDGLEQDWTGERVWCNPPYSDIEPWVAKAGRRDQDLAVLLLPANRTEQGWWQDYVERQRDRAGGLRVEFLRGRVRFVPSGADPKPNERPPFGCCLLIYHGLV